MRTLRYSLFLMLALAFASCDTDDPDDPGVVLPSNLIASVDQDDNTVDVTASADNVNFFTFTFREDGESTVVEDANGSASHTFDGNGTHSIVVRAHATQADFIETVKEVEVDLNQGGGGIPTSGFTSPLSYPGYNLVWNDEFDGVSLSSDWTHEIGTGNSGWGNNELQYYKSENTVVADGYLQITAQKEEFGGQSYTSSRIITQGRQSFSRGRIDIRAAVPQGQGIWPALWMLGDNFSTVGWPRCGEIDIMEMVGGSGNKNATTHGTIHWDNNGSHAEYGGSKTISDGILADNFHVYSIIWDASSIKWLLDDQQFHSADITPAELSEFSGSFFFIFNVAVGGNWPGSPDATTVFPQTMAVDYVRVFQ